MAETDWMRVYENPRDAAELIDRLKNLVADLVDLVEQMPIERPQQSTRRKILRGQAELFGVFQQKPE